MSGAYLTPRDSGTIFDTGAQGPAKPVVDKLIKAMSEGKKANQLEMVRQAMVDLKGLIDATTDGPKKESLKRAYEAGVTSQQELAAAESLVIDVTDNTADDIKTAIQEIINYNYTTNSSDTTSPSRANTPIQRLVRTYFLSKIIKADGDTADYPYSEAAHKTFELINGHPDRFLEGCNISAIQGKQTGRNALSKQLFNCAVAAYNNQFPSQKSTAKPRADNYVTEEFYKHRAVVNDPYKIETLYFQMKKLFPGLGEPAPAEEIDTMIMSLNKYWEKENLSVNPILPNPDTTRNAWIVAVQAVIDKQREVIAATDPGEKSTKENEVAALVLARTRAYNVYQAAARGRPPAPAPAPAPPAPGPRTAITDMAINDVFKTADKEIRITHVNGDDVFGLEHTTAGGITSFTGGKTDTIAQANTQGWTKVTDAAEGAEIRGRVKYALTINVLDSIAAGSETPFTVTSVPPLPPGLAVTWTKDNANVTIDVTSGKITGVNPGDSVIKATILSLGIEASKTITVTGPPRTPIADTDIIVNAVFTCGDVEIRITHVNGDNVYGLERTGAGVISSFNNTKDALVSEANNAGTEWTKVPDATAEDIRGRVKYALTVAGADSVAIGDNTTFTVTSAPDLPSGLAVTWTKDNANVNIDVTSGKITGVNPGDSVIKATILSLGIEASKTITVTDAAGPPPPPPGPRRIDSAILAATDIVPNKYYLCTLKGQSSPTVLFKFSSLMPFIQGYVKTTTTDLETHREFNWYKNNVDELVRVFKEEYSTITISDTKPTDPEFASMVGGARKYRKTRNRKTNLRRKTGKRSKPSRPSQSF